MVQTNAEAHWDETLSVKSLFVAVYGRIDCDGHFVPINIKIIDKTKKTIYWTIGEATFQHISSSFSLVTFLGKVVLFIYISGYSKSNVAKRGRHQRNFFYQNLTQ